MARPISTLSKKMRIIPQDDRNTYLHIVLGTAFLIVLYAIIHDQYLVRVAPAHFTEYHPAVFPFQNHTILATCFAITATTGPGLLLGMLMYGIARLGSRKRESKKCVFLTVLMIIVVLESISVTFGRFAPNVFHSEWFPFSQSWYPDQTEGIIITQTTQITCYLLAPILSLAGLLFIHRKRAQQDGVDNA